MPWVFDPFKDLLPVQFGPMPVALIGEEGRRGFPSEVFGVINAAFNDREGAELLCHLNAGLHREVADELHDLPTELQGFF